MVKGLGCNEAYAEDMVQEAYLRMHKYLSRGTDISYNGDDVNTYYFYLTLRAVYIGSVERKSVENASQEFNNDIAYSNQEYQIDSNDFDADNSKLTELMNNIFKEVNSWDFYHKNMFIAYFTTDDSLRKIGKKTNIGTNSLYNSTKKYKKIIKSKFDDEYKRYLKSKH